MQWILINKKTSESAILRTIGFSNFIMSESEHCWFPVMGHEAQSLDLKYIVLGKL